MKTLLAAGALALALGSAACTSTGALSPTAQTDIANALAVACPVEAAVAAQLTAKNVALNTQQQAAETILAGLCPPNPAPTNATVAAIDIVSAYLTIQPLVK
ncbi:MAG: hypothetical protein ACLQE9_21045 [Roseiarcus sp.]